MTTRATPSAGDYAILIGAQLAVGSAAILARVGLADGLGPIALSAWRLTIASAALLLAVPVLGKGRETGNRVARRDAVLLALAGVLLGAHFAAWFASLERIPVARSTLLVCTSPVFAGLIGVVFLRQRIPSRFWWGLLVAGIGILGVMGAANGLRGAEWIGDLLALAGAAAIALYLVTARMVQPRIGAARLVTCTYTAAAVSLWPFALFMDSERLLPGGLAGWGSILGMALIPQLIGHTAMNWSLRRFTAAAVGTATLLEPIFAALLAWWLYEEFITALQAVSAAVLLLGVALAITARMTEPPAS